MSYPSLLGRDQFGPHLVPLWSWCVHAATLDPSRRPFWPKVPVRSRTSIGCADLTLEATEVRATTALRSGCEVRSGEVLWDLSCWARRNLWCRRAPSGTLADRPPPRL